MTLTFISKEDFDSLPGIRQIIVHDHPRKFAALDIGSVKGPYGLSWRSDLVEPLIESAQHQPAVWIGVDQRVAAIDTRDGRVLLSLPLSSNLTQIIVSQDVAVVITELEATLFNADFSIRLIKGLPDIPISAHISSKTVFIQLLEDKEIHFDIVTGR